ncbi:MAG: VOC family protein [Acidobacteria bacterium]|nr:VOC family protein [Acidobacteriota bacterium]
MANIEKHAPGSFCWAELGTTDVRAGGDFYSSLLTWGVKDVSSGDMQYSILELDGAAAAGLYGLMPEQLQLGVPPNWMIYVAVEDADATAAKATELGARVFVGPENAMDAGRFAIIQDPQGAIFGIWQPIQHIGSQVGGLNYRQCWSELGTTDSVAALDFYSKLFGWGVHTQEMGGCFTYHTWLNQGTPGGGMYQLTAEMAGVPPHWMVYFSVPDCDGTAAKAAELGGTVRVPPTDIPGVGRFSLLVDPQGAVFSVIQLKMP